MPHPATQVKPHITQSLPETRNMLLASDAIDESDTVCPLKPFYVATTRVEVHHMTIIEYRLYKSIDQPLFTS
jgi:hypothetical protein